MRRAEEKRSLTLRPQAAAAAAFLALAIGGTAAADPLADTGRGLVGKFADAVPTVKLVIKQEMAFGGRQGTARESKSEATGTVVDPSGLIVVSLSSTDPGGMLQRMMMNMGGGEESKLQVESSVSDVKIVMPDGREAPAQIVLRDRELDAAFIRPLEKPAKPMASLSDAGPAAKPRIMDEVLLLARLGAVANRALAISTVRVAAVVERPRLFYIPDGVQEMSEMGGPVFAADGRPVGILLLRTVKTEGSASLTAMFSGAQNLGIMPVVIPLDDIMESAKQAPAAKEKETAKPAAEKEAVPKNL